MTSNDEARIFDIGDIISAGSGVIVSPRGFEAVYDVLSFMSGERVFTHQLVRVIHEATPVLLEQHPELTEAFKETEQVNQENWREWLDIWIARYGAQMSIFPMTRDQHERIDPFTEMKEKMPFSEIVVVKS